MAQQVAKLLTLDEETEAQPLWQPNPDHPDGTPNPQRLALESKADELFYGGAAGGGKSDLLLGLSLSVHKKSVIFRRNYTLLKDLIRRSVEMIGNSDNFNKSEKVWDTGDRVLEFGAMKDEDDKKNWQGRPHSLKGFDEIPEFSRTQYLFAIAWNRSTDPTDAPCRVVVTGNPPIDEAGNWVIEDWGPWLQPDHPHKAEPGELKWYYYDGDHLVWLDNDEPVEVDGQIMLTRSRTFIPAKLDDNPHLKDTAYKTVLNSLPEELRYKFRDGDFSASQKTNPWQVIPTAWVKAAQRRWLEREKPDMPLSGVGVDLVRGGADCFGLSKRYGTWFDEIIKVPGVNVEDGPQAAGLIFHALENETHVGYINMDVIGVGSSGFDSAKVMWPGLAKAINVAEASDYVAMSKTNPPAPLFRMRNKRAEMHWRMREDLDPEHGKDLALPPGPEILADLCAAQYMVQAGGVIQIEKKDDIKKRLGRSPDVGEAVMLANGKDLDGPATTQKVTFGGW